MQCFFPGFPKFLAQIFSSRNSQESGNSWCWEWGHFSRLQSQNSQHWELGLEHFFSARILGIPGIPGIPGTENWELNVFFITEFPEFLALKIGNGAVLPCHDPRIPRIPGISRISRAGIWEFIPEFLEFLEFLVLETS